MDIVILGTGLAVIAVLVLFSIFRQIRGTSSDVQRDEEALNQARSDNAVLESRLQSTQEQLNDTQRQLDVLRGVEIENTRLHEGLANEKAVATRNAEVQKAAEARRDELQAEVQKLTAEVRGLKTELGSKDESLRDELNENAELRKQTAELTDQVNKLTAKVSNLNTQLENAEERLGERDVVEKRFSDAFKTLSSDVLKAQGETFKSGADATLKSRQEAVEKLIKPLNEQIVKLEEARAESTGALSNELKRLSEQTNNLTTAMSRPEFRGRWAEIQVERVLELSGLKRGIDYETQYVDDQGTRPDFVIRMPNERILVLDSKISLPALQQAAGATTENQRTQALDEHARQVRRHADQLATKRYWDNLEKSPEFVVMVIPDFAYQPAVERDSELLDRALDKKVIIVTPHMLFALLQIVERNWREERSRENLEEVLVLGKELYERLGVLANRIKSMGDSLETTLTRYDAVVGSWDRRIAPTISRFQELDVRVGDDPPELVPIEDPTPRVLQRELASPSQNGDAS